MNPQLANLREFGGWGLFGVCGPWTGIATSIPITDEVFAVITGLSEVKVVGLEFVKKQTKLPDAECEQLYYEFQAFVRQGKAFFTSARNLHHRASPLFYYYAFLNLAKAILCLRSPQTVTAGSRIVHGLSEKPQGSPFDKQMVKVEKAGVFPELYTALTGRKIDAGTEFAASALVEYMSDASFDPAGKALAGRKTARGRSRILFSADTSIVSVLLAIAGFDTLFPQQALDRFHTEFERIDVPSDPALHVFFLRQDQKHAFGFFQSKDTWDRTSQAGRETSQRINAIIQHYLVPSVFDSEEGRSDDFVISIPVGPQFSFQWNEFFAGYLLFYYLGSLVRYRPRYIEVLLESREAWQIEQIVNGASVTMLRHFLNFILGKPIVISPR